MKLVPSAAIAAVVLVAATACSGSVSVGSNSVSKSDLEEAVSTQLTETVGQAPDDVTCEGGLEAEVDAEQRCELEAGGDRVGLTVTATEVDDSDVSFDIVVDDEVVSE
ncbi:DUF4333 domain-containing protein [Nocardioides sp.]|uniref:DUF4333 domain-containing protein n=1 Tax=Nocardioides sp. TaxID=35761 RepID=UPI0027361119|nr:DUF4333 domain-containing protein [Nocardioides sp.]MDP3894456.1 DUF4333 domain-containing protein [Nocardioides sp.]